MQPSCMPRMAVTGELEVQARWDVIRLPRGMSTVAQNGNLLLTTAAASRPTPIHRVHRHPKGTKVDLRLQNPIQGRSQRHIPTDPSATLRHPASVSMAQVMLSRHHRQPMALSQRLKRLACVRRRITTCTHPFQVITSMMFLASLPLAQETGQLKRSACIQHYPPNHRVMVRPLFQSGFHRQLGCPRRGKGMNRLTQKLPARESKLTQLAILLCLSPSRFQQNNPGRRSSLLCRFSTNSLKTPTAMYQTTLTWTSSASLLQQCAEESRRATAYLIR